MMLDLGFELRDDLYSLRMTKKYVRTEREQAQEYLHEVYLQMCRLEEDGKKKLRRLVKTVSEPELKKLLKSRGLSTRVLPDEDLSDRVLELLEDEAIADAVARANRGEPIPDDIKQLLAQEQKEHESSWWAAIGWAGLSNKQQVVHDTCLAQTSHPPFVESMDECQARNFHALEVEKKSPTAKVKRR